MLTVPYDFYQEMYGGNLSESNFNRLSPQATALVNYYTDYALEKLEDNDVDPYLLYNYRCLICILSDKEEKNAETGGAVVKSQSSGKVSESYVESSLPRNSGVVTIDLIEKYLSRYGFCCRWV